MERPSHYQRDRIRARLKAIGAPCAICGREINYDLDWWTDPKDGKRKRHPLSFEYDHITPYSLARDDVGVNSFDNAQAVHRACNLRKSNKVGTHTQNGNARPRRMPDGGSLPVSRAW